MSIDESSPCFVHARLPRPSRVLRPADEQECAAGIVRAVEDGLAVVPYGGGTAIEHGNGLRARAFAALSAEGLCGVVDYSPADMVVTVRAGMTLNALQDCLRAEGQYLPIDCARAGTATLGGIVATNRQGLWRGAFGAPRDRLLALRAVLADGGVARAGAKVVKNVAGYDLCKLFAGSWGTLGVITEVTFKTNPVPEAEARSSYGAPTVEAAAEVAVQIHREHLDAAYAVCSGGPPWVLSVSLTGGRAAIGWQRGEIDRLAVSAGLSPTAEGPSEEQLREWMTDAEAPVVCRVSVVPTDVPALAARLAARASRLRCGVAAGIVEAAFDGTEARSPAVTDFVRQQLPGGATVVWPRLRVPWADDVDAWGGVEPGGIRLMRGIKAALDPGGVFSPGRFVGGI